MAQPDANLTELQFLILDGMADDYEDIEQLYLFANRDFGEEERRKIEHPHKMLRDRYPLREIIDEIARMLRGGYIEAKYSSHEQVAPLEPVDAAFLHHYWFGATQKGTEARKAFQKQIAD